jgi:hypothetical protein
MLFIAHRRRTHLAHGHGHAVIRQRIHIDDAHGCCSPLCRPLTEFVLQPDAPDIGIAATAGAQDARPNRNRFDVLQCDESFHHEP